MEAGRWMRCAPLFAALLVVGFATTSVAVEEGAQERRGGGGGARNERILAVLTERVDLTEEQQKAVRPILDERSKTMRELRQRARNGEDREAVRTEMDALIESSSKKVEALLTEKQLPVYRKFREERRNQAQQRRKRPGGGQPR